MPFALIAVTLIGQGILAAIIALSTDSVMTITVSSSYTALLSSVMILCITVATVSLIDKLEPERTYGCQRQSHFTTGSLAPISSSWHQAH
jgi:hypothetical protein